MACFHSPTRQALVAVWLLLAMLVLALVVAYLLLRSPRRGETHLPPSRPAAAGFVL